MTAQEIVEALCEAQAQCVYDYGLASAIARRDAIKAALVGALEDYDAIVGDNGQWRKLEEACRGKA